MNEQRTPVRQLQTMARLALILIAAVLGLCFAFIAALAFSGPARAGDLTLEQAAAVYAIAYGHVGGAMPERAPTIYLVDRPRLQQLACNGGNCPARGWQQGEAVYIDGSLDFARPADAAVLLHELVHWFQFARWGPAQDCLDWIARERQAYLIQAYELERMGVDPSSVLATARSVGCG